MTEQSPAAGAGSLPAPAVASSAVVGPQPRAATPADVPEILRLIRELAAYERSLHEVVATPEGIEALLFASDRSGPLPGPVAACLVVEEPEPGPAGHPAPDAPRLAGFALYFRSASTWLGRPGLYLEDLYVSPRHRGRGLGRDLLATLAAVCVEHGFGRLEWSVLDWNVDAIGFYGSLGARPMDAWTVHRLAGSDLDALARLAPAPPTD